MRGAGRFFATPGRMADPGCGAIMARPSRAPRIAKWAGLAACVLTAATWIASLFYSVRWYGAVVDTIFIRTGPGACTFEVLDIRASTPNPDFPPGHKRCIYAPGLTYRRTERPKVPIIWLPEVNPLTKTYQVHHMPSQAIITYTVRGTSCIIPLWIPFLIAAIPTALLFYGYRRRPGPGCCQACAYDLTGNVSGVCPECGSLVDSS